MKINSRKNLFLLLITFFFCYFSYAQDSLSMKYNQMMLQSETYEVYKVIKIDRINNFWEEVKDSINNQQTEIKTLKSDKIDLLNEIEGRAETINKLNSDLQYSIENSDSILLFGASLKKSVYHLIVWVIISVLIALLVIVFGIAKRSNIIAKEKTSDYLKLFNEFEVFRDKSRENQVKIKRELQTALNSLEELKKGRK